MTSTRACDVYAEVFRWVVGSTSLMPVQSVASCPDQRSGFFPLLPGPAAACHHQDCHRLPIGSGSGRRLAGPVASSSGHRLPFARGRYHGRGLARRSRVHARLLPLRMQTLQLGLLSDQLPNGCRVLFRFALLLGCPTSRCSWRPHVFVTVTSCFSPVVNYHGLACPYLAPLPLLMRPQLNGGTLGRQGFEF
jgi:hypothetical protein